MKHKRVVLLTGATGLVGSYLLKILLGKSFKVYALTRNKDEKTAKERVKNVLNFWDKNILHKAGSKLVILEGDITKENLGLRKRKRDLLKEEVVEIFHSAAVTKINLPLKEIRKINVEGTRNLLKLGVDLSSNGKLKKINHISTIYVCGDYKGTFHENLLDVNQKFNNTYEQTKFEAEKLVYKYREKGLWIDIFRPPILTGESSTGRTFQFKHIYQLLHICSLNIFDALPLLNVKINLSPVDLTVKAILRISCSTSQKNKTYHPFPVKPVGFKPILYTGHRVIGHKIPKLINERQFRKNKLSFVQRKILGNNIMAINRTVRFSSLLTNNVLYKIGFCFKQIDQKLLEKIIKYPKTIKFYKNYKF